MTLPTKIALGSIAVGVLILGLKYAAFLYTGSIALYSDALESIVNVASSLATLAAVWFAQRPADSNHPYGHDKAEYFGAVVVGVMIVLTALSIFREAWLSYQSPAVIVSSPLGLGLNGFASVINGLWAYIVIRTGKRAGSPALVADGKHLVTDVISSIGVLAGVFLVIFTGIQKLDSVLATLVGINILWSGWHLVKESVGGLMDEAVEPQLLSMIRELISEHAEGALEAHDLRTRHSGRAVFMEFHLVVPGSMTVDEAHAICDRIEEAIREKITGARITIHVEPDHEAEHRGIVVL